MPDPTPATTPRKLIVLCDGTFNDPADNTNVFKFKNALARPDQLVYYDEGVGITEEGNRKGWFGKTVDSLMGGAFGSGLSMNVQQAYRWVCDNYQDGDELYFLGFSRGAYTARSIVGMIRKLGLIRAPLERNTLAAAFSQYRNEHHPNCPEIEKFRDKLNTRRVEDVCLRFLGVWDTVGALGVPVVGPRSLVARHRWGFHDTRLSSHVVTARQSLAIDEKRAAFLPAPWCADAKRQEKAPDSVKQVWFPGCHSDIGGGNGHITFHWMLREAASAGLEFDPPLNERGEPTQSQILHESLSTFYRIGTGSVRRPIAERFPTDEPAADEERWRFLNESISVTAGSLRVKMGTDAGGHPTYGPVPLQTRENLTRESMRGPKPGWGLTLAYYLSQYDDLCGEPKDCCDLFTEWKKGAPGP